MSDQKEIKQECMPVGCVPPSRWPYPIVSAQPPIPDSDPPRQTPWTQTPPWLQTPVGRPTWADKADPPRQIPPRQTPPPLWTEGMTHACENITFPQLFAVVAGGKNDW